MTTAMSDVQSVLRAPGGRWRTIDDRGTVAFEVMTLWGLATVRGAFQRYRGTLSVGPDETAAELMINAASVTTRSARRDSALRSDAFLNVDHHPEVTFKSRSVDVGLNGLLVDGTLTIAGVTQGCRLELDIRPGEDGTITMSGITEIDRAAFGLVTNRLGMLVGNVVASIELELEPEAA